MNQVQITNKIKNSMVLYQGRLQYESSLPNAEKRILNQHCKNVVNVKGKPLLERYIAESQIRIVKFGAKNFTAKEYDIIKEYCKKNKLIIQPNAKDFMAKQHKFPVIYLSDRDITKNFLKELDIYEEFMNNVSDQQKLTRHTKLLGECIFMPESLKPRVQIGGKYEHEGVIIVSQAYAHKVNNYWKDKGIDVKIIYGSKSAFVLKSTIYLVEVTKDCEYDIIVPEDENKLKLSAEKLSKLFAINPSIDSEKAYSKNLKEKHSNRLGRKPNLSLDTACLLGVKPYTQKLQFVKDILEEKIDKETIAHYLFSFERDKVDDNNMPVLDKYNNQVKEKVLNKYGQAILEGKSIYHNDIWPEADKILAHLFHQKIVKKVGGLYGQVMPRCFLETMPDKPKEEKTEGLLMRYPLTIPIKCDITICNDMLFVPEDLWKLMGGDYDGDLGTYLYGKDIKSYFDWNDEKSKAELISILQLPLKEKTNDKMDMVDAQFQNAEVQAKIGSVYNNNKTMLLAYQYMGMNMKDIVTLDIYNNATITQKCIDSLKYKGDDSDFSLNFFHEYNMNNAEKLNIKSIPEVVPTNLLKKARKYYNMVKNGGSIAEIINDAKYAKADSINYFEKIAAYIKDWPIKIKKDDSIYTSFY